MEYYYIKALHIIFIVTWFAGLFYIVRLFIYHVEADSKQQPDKGILQRQYKIMSKSLKIHLMFGLFLWLAETQKKELAILLNTQRN